MQNLNNTILDYVQERPDPTLSWQNPVCPECGSIDLQDKGTESTCVGWFPAKPEDDTPDCPGNPNSSTRQHICNTCGLGFYYCTRFGNIWVLEDNGKSFKVLAGIPNGISLIVQYTCTTCGGAVTIEYLLSGKIIYPGSEAGYRLMCRGCGLDAVLSTTAGYNPEIEYKNAFHGSGPVRFSEQPGICVLNSRGINKGKIISS